MSQLNSIEFRFFSQGDNTSKLFFQIKYLNKYSAHVGIDKVEFLKKRGHLTERLTDFVKDSNPDTLLKLAEAGYSVFVVIDEALKRIDKSFYSATWKRNILNDVTRPNADLNKIKKPSLHLECIFPPDFSFCMGLLYPRYPSENDWKKYSMSDLLQVFFDFRFKITNAISPLEFKGGLNLTCLPIKRNGNKIKAIHAIDANLKISAAEKQCFAPDPDIARFKAESVEQLTELWNKEEYPRLILFSTHYELPATASFSFRLTIDDFTDNELYKVARKIPHHEKALFFLNCCNTGSIPDAGFNNVFTKLYPFYSLGFITTGYDLKNSDAEYFPQKFYEIFLLENMIIIDAFAKTKNYLIFQSDVRHYAALGYMLWQVPPRLKYIEPKTKRKKINLLKNQKVNNFSQDIK